MLVMKLLGAVAQTARSKSSNQYSLQRDTRSKAAGVLSDGLAHALPTWATVAQSPHYKCNHLSGTMELADVLCADERTEA